MSEETRPPNFGFGEEEQMLRDLARKFLDEHFPVQKLRDQVALDSDAAYTRGERSPWNESVWKQMEDGGGQQGALRAARLPYGHPVAPRALTEARTPTSGGERRLEEGRRGRESSPFFFSP